MRTFLTLTFGLALAFCSSSAFGQLTYDESVDGDLSGALGSPTALSFGAGLNTITGDIGSTNSGGATDGTDADYFWFTVGAGQTVDSITTTRSGPGTQSFIGYVAGTAFAGQTAGDIDANALFSDGESLLPGELSATPLAAGNHAFWLQEIGGATDYSISFNVTAVPEPSSAITLIGLGLIGFVRRRR